MCGRLDDTLGYKHTPWVLELKGLNHNEKVVLWCLTMHANNRTHRTWVSVGKIAEECGYSPNSRVTVRRALRSLRDKGLITYREQRAGAGEKQSSNTYTVKWASTPGAVSTIPPELTTPGPGAESTTNGAPNEEAIDEEPNTPSSCDDVSDSLDTPSSDDDGARKKTPAEADPVSPAWYRSPQRHHALDLIQRLGVLKANRAPYSDTEQALIEHLNQSFKTDRFSFLLDYGSWATTLTDRHKAAIKLNQVINMSRDY